MRLADARSDQRPAVDVRQRQARDLPEVTAALREVHDADAYPTNWPLDPAGFLTPQVGLTA